MADFDSRKAATMAAISSPSPSQPDKSPKGSIDIPIIPLLTTINNHPSFYTTSSCSGRISIFSHHPTKPKGGNWLFITHELADPNSVISTLFPSESTRSGPTQAVSSPTQFVLGQTQVGTGTTREETGSNRGAPDLTRSVGELTRSKSGRELVFRFEPLIIAVECRDVGSAQFLVSLARSCGFRESGITSVGSKRVIMAVRSSIRMEVPLGREREVMVGEEYVRYLVEVANEKMGANWKRIEGFMGGLRKNGFGFEFVTNGGVVGNWSGCEEEGVEFDNESVNLGTDSGPLRSSCSSIAITPIRIVGEPLERLFLWGHSSCTVSYAHQKQILIFGGFGGIGRHARRNDCLLFDPSSGSVTALNANGSPCPRVGHTSSVIGDIMFVIGGRADPANILDDLWIFDIAKTEWKLVQSSGDLFAPRHRHAAAAIGSKIYVFGGLHNDTLYSSLLVLDVDTLQWKGVHPNGEWPCGRHSHALVACGFKLYLFGGYDGEKALGDLYSFDVQECRWSKVKTTGKPPYPRFSHSMFVYKDYLGIIGGCPVKQHCQELSLLNLQKFNWEHVIIDSVGRDLFVRSTANIIDENLIMTGGGAAIYAFGTKFSEPAKINLLPLASLGDASVSCLVDEKLTEKGNTNAGLLQNGTVESSEIDLSVNLDGKATNGEIGSLGKGTYWVIKLQKKYAKLAKDILKKFGWLDLGRKVYSHEDGSCIYFPVTEKLCAVFSDELSQTSKASKGLNEIDLAKTSIDSYSTALNVLVTCGASKHVDEFVAMKKGPLSPLEAMRAAVASILKDKGLSEGLLQQLPKRWERLGDIAVLPLTSFNDPAWDSIGSELWLVVSKSLGARRLARQGRVAPTGTRDSRLEILVGDNGWVEHRENGIVYCFDATKCMFSWGNLSEKLRMARLDCSGEVVVDLFAGIGYFTLPFLVRANAKLVYACEWNPFAVEALQHNLQVNSMSDRCIVIEGDNRLTAPKGVADRVCLGLLPSSEGSWVTAVRALRSEGGMLHIHENVKDSEETQWTEHVTKSICEIALSEGRCWDVSLVHLEKVKWYAPHIRHVVADVRCKQIQT